LTRDLEDLIAWLAQRTDKTSIDEESEGYAGSALL
jgi:hypothetical protein